jgi:hypothetical protein
MREILKKISATIYCAEDGGSQTCQWSDFGEIPYSDRRVRVSSVKKSEFSGADLIYRHHNRTHEEYHLEHGHMNYRFETVDGRKGDAGTTYGTMIIFHYHR